MGIFGKPKAPERTQEQKDADERQSLELDRLEKKEQSQKDAMKRRRGGRASLLSGGERGVTDTLGG